MGRHSTVPDLFEDCKTICITKLRGWGYICPYAVRTGTITWSRNGVETSSIGIKILMDQFSGSITFNYSVDKEPVNYEINIISRPANIGNGLQWFFVCPKTGRVCRKLHLGHKYFLHRTAFNGYMYELQTWSKNTRYLAYTPMYLEMKADGIYEQIYTKHFKKYYNGKPTKRYVNLLKKIRERPGLPSKK